jgi:catechol 2,3-dioxygenase-like lactoylglutathione lyase family enzyme
MPLVQNITQVGIVVRDLDAALHEYADRLGVRGGSTPMRRHG